MITTATRYESVNFEKEQKYQLHPLAQEDGGMKLQDDGNLIPDLIKTQMKRVGQEIAKG